MCQANNEKQKTTHDGRNGTIRSRKNENAQGKGNLEILENIVQEIEIWPYEQMI